MKWENIHVYALTDNSEELVPKSVELSVSITIVPFRLWWATLQDKFRRMNCQECRNVFGVSLVLTPKLPTAGFADP